MRIGIGGVAAITVAVSMLEARLAGAQDVHCPPHRGNTTVNGNLLVAAPCELERTRVEGNVELHAGGSLLARDVRIDGNLEGRSAFEVQLDDSRVRGNVELVELVGDSSAIVDTRVDGSIQLRSNRSFVRLDDNDVDSHIQVLGNTGGVDIVDNRVDGHLECRDNDPAPTGGGNRVRGDEAGQCQILGELEVGTPPATGGGDTPADSGTEPPADSDDTDPPADGGGADAPADSGGTGSTGGGSGTNAATDPIPFTPQTSGGGGGSTDPLTLLAAALLLLACRRSSLPTRTVSPRDAWR